MLPDVTHKIPKGSLGVLQVLPRIATIRKANSLKMGNKQAMARQIEIAIGSQMTPQERETHCEPVRIKRTFAQSLRGAQAAAKLAVPGLIGLVEPKVALANAKTCIGCPENLNPARSLKEKAEDAAMAAAVKAANRGHKPTTKVDAEIFHCKNCGGCPLKSKVHIPLRLIQKGMTQADVDSYPPYCFQIRGLKQSPPKPGKKPKPAKKKRKRSGCNICGSKG